MSFKETINVNTMLGYFEGEIPVNYQYTLGVGGNKFFTALMEKGEFIASECTACGVKTIYPLIYCEECFAPIEKYISLGVEGELYSFTECHYDYQGNKYDKPHVLGLVRFPGVRGGIFHRIAGNMDSLRIGMKVVAKLKPKAERSGTIDDIICFETA
ncbi:MAG: Zn-ribbon domain-containing OB-fold protein [Spirochaetes bacterium]|nr:Zn-ribbon domain-containing OB-fold protein [Spirochaetota bacterium]